MHLPYSLHGVPDTRMALPVRFIAAVSRRI